MDTLTDADTRRGGNHPPHAGFSSSVSPKASKDGVSSSYALVEDGEKPVWLTLRITYVRIEQTVEFLCQKNVETFVAKHTVSHFCNGKKVVIQEYLLSNIFFARITLSCALLLLETSTQHFPSHIRFFRKKLLPRESNMIHPPLLISDREMDNFMMLANVENEHIKVTEKELCRFKTDEDVLVTKGAFKEVPGRLARMVSEQRMMTELADQWLIATACSDYLFENSRNLRII